MKKSIILGVILILVLSISVIGICGDGILDLGEQCDDEEENGDPGMTCSDTCQLWTCSDLGNGNIQMTHGGGLDVFNAECDINGNALRYGCSADLSFYTTQVSGCSSTYPCVMTATGPECQEVNLCGNGIVEIDLGEECDDGNTIDGDGCNYCVVQEGYICAGRTPSVCVEELICGNGIIDLDEECDDGNVVSEDGCDSSCVVEDDFSCTGQPSNCVFGSLTYTCGNNILEPGEGCDDGNTKNGDGCDAYCVVELLSPEDQALCNAIVTLPEGDKGLVEGIVYVLKTYTEKGFGEAMSLIGLLQAWFNI